MVMAVMLPVALLAVFDHSFSVVSERGSLWIEPTACGVRLCRRKRHAVHLQR